MAIGHVGPTVTPDGNKANEKAGKPDPWRVLDGSTTPTVQTPYYNPREVDLRFDIYTRFVKQEVRAVLPFAIAKRCLSELYDFCNAVAIYAYTRIMTGTEGGNQGHRYRNVDKHKARAKSAIVSAYKAMHEKRLQLLKKLV